MNTGTMLTRSGALGHLKTLDDVVSDYKVRFKFKHSAERSEGHHDPCVDFCKESRSISMAIARAVDGRRRDGKMFPGGSCVRTQAKKQLTLSLWRAERKIRLASDFDELYDIVAKHVGGIFGVSRYTTYNVSLRIGAYLNLEPRAHIYLHAGPLKGWKRLTGHGGDIFRVPWKEVPRALRRLKPHSVEDLLCEMRELLHPGMLE
jgi:hypothetical protein